MVSKGGLGQDGSRLERGRRAAAGGTWGTIRVQARAGTCMSTRIAPGCSERCDGVESLGWAMGWAMDALAGANSLCPAAYTKGRRRCGWLARQDLRAWAWRRDRQLAGDPTPVLKVTPAISLITAVPITATIIRRQLTLQSISFEDINVSNCPHACSM
jgi:hypothetical protein